MCAWCPPGTLSTPMQARGLGLRGSHAAGARVRLPAVLQPMRFRDRREGLPDRGARFRLPSGQGVTAGGIGRTWSWYSTSACAGGLSISASFSVRFLNAPPDAWLSGTPQADGAGGRRQRPVHRGRLRRSEHGVVPGPFRRPSSGRGQSRDAHDPGERFDPRVERDVLPLRPLGREPFSIPNPITVTALPSLPDRTDVWRRHEDIHPSAPAGDSVLGRDRLALRGTGDGRCLELTYDSALGSVSALSLGSTRPRSRARPTVPLFRRCRHPKPGPGRSSWGSRERRKSQLRLPQQCGRLPPRHDHGDDRRIHALCGGRHADRDAAYPHVAAERGVSAQRHPRGRRRGRHRHHEREPRRHQYAAGLLLRDGRRQSVG